MIFTKFLFLLSVFVFLAGCIENRYALSPLDPEPCTTPGSPHNAKDDRGNPVTCKYTLEVVGQEGNMLKTKVPESVLQDNINSGKSEGVDYDLSNYPRNNVYYFAVLESSGSVVKDLSGFTKGTVLHFHKPPGGDKYGLLLGPGN